MPVIETLELLEMEEVEVQRLRLEVASFGRIIEISTRRKASPSESMLRADWFAVDQTKQISGRPIARTIRSIFRDIEEEVLSNLAGVVPDALAAFRAGGLDSRKQDDTDPIGEALFDVEAWADEIESKLGPLFRSVAEDGFNSGLARAGVSGIDFTSGAPIVSRVISQSLEKARGISSTTASILGRRIGRDLEAGKDLDEIEATVRGVFTEARSWRTRMITRTSVTAGFEAGQNEAYVSSGVKFKIWLTERDDLVREGTIYDHRVMDGVKVKVAEFFQVGPDEMMHPGDPMGSAGNVINCRCTTRPGLD